ncbi:hypothetical protein GGS23DRAFT_613335 [Durotheca rogersii]|uniref:uncharacterized protein n=1 Tax=Durotheca rogersii TaxID=419775 RepID=UPI00222075CA|nr:uncharacterized protein GGS23DRAFT_613335 [Durotheca rogersii]KAI5860820.1 hypothetical protein GGS23DRAFT_613335 [Durotheca rogersii]
MASSQYGSLAPIQQYNQLALQAAAAASSQHHQLHHRQPLQAAAPAPAYPRPPILPPANGLHDASASLPGAPAASNTGGGGGGAISSGSSSSGNVRSAPGDGALTPPQAKRRRVGRPPKSAAAREYQGSAAGPPAAAPARRPPEEEQHRPHPLNKGPYATAEDAVFALQLHVFTSGYGVSQKRTVKEKLASGRYDPDGEVIRKDFTCDRGGSEFVSHSTGERRRESRKCGCAWRAVVRLLKREGDRWFVDVLDPAHNHAATPPAQMHTVASYRRWQRDNNAGVRAAIARLARAAALPAPRVAAYLRGDAPDPDLDRVDRHILRALSISDVELPPAAADPARPQPAIVFDVVAHRPTIVLQSGGGGGPGAGAGSAADADAPDPGAGTGATLESYMMRYGQPAA